MMRPVIVSVATNIVAAAILAVVVFGVAYFLSPAPFGLHWPNVLRYLAYALGLAIFGSIGQYALMKVGLIATGTARPRHAAIELMLAVLVLGMMTAIFVVGMR